MVSAKILNFELVLLFLHYLINPHQVYISYQYLFRTQGTTTISKAIWWECWESDIERNCCIKNAYLRKFKMAAAAILNFENRLPFHYYWTNRHNIWWECWESDIDRNYCIKNAYLRKFKMAAAAFYEFWKSVAISLLLNQSSPNLVGMLRIWHRTQMLHQHCIITKSQDGGGRHL